MSHGHNHAKQIVIDAATCLADKLQNGDSGCVETQGRAIALIVKMITPLYQAEFITVQECSNLRSKKATKITKLKIGPFSFEGQLTSALVSSVSPVLCCGALAYMLGKAQGWW